ncbi:MAG: hypothetical protein M9920_07285 [Verrucomicrobiae bacterium]|nr:hypothetical protein [Verrucomicrobiae bacterium]
MATNGVKAGVYHRKISDEPQTKGGFGDKSSFLTDWQIIPALSGVSTNDVLMWLAPQQSWLVRLTSADGKGVKKTAAGRSLGAPMKIGNKGLQESGFVALRVNSDLPSLPGKGFKLSDFFNVKQPGVYTLEVSLCGMVVTNSKAIPTYFGPTKTVLNISD